MVELKNSSLTVRIAERGAEIVSVKNAAGYEYIWQADPRFWAKHSPLLFPVCGRLLGNFGSHEAYAAGGEFSDWSVRFEHTEDLTLAEQKGGYLTGAAVPYAQGVRELPLRYEMFADDSMLFRGLKSRRIRLLHAGKPVTEVEFSPYEHLLLWTKPGAPYICIEPWNGVPDYADADGELPHKKGILRIDGGGEIEMEHAVTFFTE